jgi:hypothetical protein
MNILARYARTQKYAAITAAAITQRHAQVFHPRHVSVAQHATGESIYYSHRNT